MIDPKALLSSIRLAGSSNGKVKSLGIFNQCTEKFDREALITPETGADPDVQKRIEQKKL
ncbi:MAG: hypothetical protein IJU76_11430 [Desulfovibrionaceae bacterium]|nr:hypothetical protein [Desulfovibrionaceae bacterium]